MQEITSQVPEWNIDPPGGEGTGQELVAHNTTRAMVEPIMVNLETEKGVK